MTQPSATAHFTVMRGDAIASARKLPRAEAQLVYLDPPFFTRKRRQGGAATYDDRWPGGMAEYLSFLRSLIRAAQPLLAPGGVIALHLDWRASHHGRLELEHAFGTGAFVNEIIWAYRTGGAGKRFLARKHDTIHVFSAGHHKFNPQREKSYLAHEYGFKNANIQRDERGPFTMAALRDVWEIPALRGNMRQSVGYPTQKPLALLSRLIACFTDPGDLVIDLCCGSGTTLVAARQLGRRGIGIDSSTAAVRVARRRLRSAES